MIFGLPGKLSLKFSLCGCASEKPPARSTRPLSPATAKRRVATHLRGERGTGGLGCPGQPARHAGLAGGHTLQRSPPLTELPSLPSASLPLSHARQSLTAFSLSFSSCHASFPQTFRTRCSPSAPARPPTTCAHGSVQKMRTSVPRTTLAWMKTSSPVGIFPQPKPPSTDHLSTTRFTALVLSATGFRQAGIVFFVLLLLLFFQPLQPTDCHVRLHVELRFSVHPGT